MKKILVVFSFFTLGLASAQQVHIVKQYDSSYDLSRKYGLSLQEFYNLNPTIKDGVIFIGDKLIVSKPVEKVVPKVPKNGQIILTEGQSIWSITKQYKISETELRKLNPDLDKNMKIGDKVTLPLDFIIKYSKGQKIIIE